MKYLKIAVSVGILAWLAWRTDWAQVADTFGRLQLGFWLAAVGVYLLAQMLSSSRWLLLSRPLGFTQPWRHFLGGYFIGMFFNLVLPTSVGGDVVRAWYLDGGTGRRVKALVSVLVERLSGLVVLLMLACGAAVLCPIALPGWVRWSAPGAAGVVAVALLAAWFYCRWRVGDRGWEEKACPVPGRFVVLQSAICNLQSAIVNQPRLLLHTTLLSLGVQAANVVMVWLVAGAVGVAAPASYWWMVVPLVSLLQVVLPSLNGHGVREGGLIVFLAPVGVPAETALTVGLLWFAVTATASLAGGPLWLVGRFSRPEVRADHDEPVGDHSDQGRARQPAAAA